MAHAPLIHAFGDVELDEALLEVRRGGKPVPLAPRSLELLRYLIAHRDRVVSKQELFETVWSGVLVSDAALAGALRDLRRAIGDDGEQQRWLQTQRRRGYRFLGPLDSRPALAGDLQPTSTEVPTPQEHEANALPELGAPRWDTRGTLPPLPRLVLGREHDISAVKQRLLAPGSALCAVHGWPGVGKTTLASLLARDEELAARYPDGVLWASLGPAADASYELQLWARALGLSALAQECPTARELGPRLSQALRSRRVLLIADDLWQLEDFAPLRVGGEHCGMLVTTRQPVLADAIALGGESYRLGLLAAHSAGELLRQLVPSAVERYPAACARLIEALEGLPLAIHVAAGLIRAEIRRGFSVDEVLAELLRDARRIYESELPGDLARDAGATVAALIERSTRALAEPTRERFAALGVFVEKPAVFDEAAIESAWAATGARETLAELVDRGLLEPAGAGLYQMHALLKTHAEALLEALG
jgi:DNA-binding winged helix-turn-helix (wHTH) protein